FRPQNEPSDPRAWSRRRRRAAHRRSGRGRRIRWRYAPGDTTPTPPASAERVFVGRARERSVLTGMLERAERGDPSVTTLVGEPGIGKTALAGEFSRLARQRGFTVVRGDADEVDRSTLSIWRGP